MESYLDPSQISEIELFRKLLKPLTILAKAPSWMYDWVLNTPFEGFLQDAPREGLAIASVVESLTITAGQKYNQ